jgi:hypothetical protein
MNPASEDEIHPLHQLTHWMQKLIKMIGDHQNEKKASPLLRLVVIRKHFFPLGGFGGFSIVSKPLTRCLTPDHERPAETSQRAKREATQRKNQEDEEIEFRICGRPR